MSFLKQGGETGTSQRWSSLWVERKTLRWWVPLKPRRWVKFVTQLPWNKRTNLALAPKYNVGKLQKYAANWWRVHIH